MNKPTKTAPETIRAIEQLRAERGIAPTKVEVAEHLGIGWSTVAERLTRLRRDGLIVFETRVARSLRVTDAGRALVANP